MAVSSLDALCAGFIAGRGNVVTPKRLPDEFIRDVVAVARRCDSAFPQVITDFEVEEEMMSRWIHRAGIDAGNKNWMTSAEQSELVRLRREKRLLEMENEILRRAAAYFAQFSRNQLPTGP